MPSSIAHALTALPVGAALLPTDIPRRVWIAGFACAVVPDIDAIGRPFGFGDLAFLGGHRALTHSLPFAIALSFVVVAFLCRHAAARKDCGRTTVLLVVATASHGLLDTLTAYGEGVTLLAPFSMQRYTAPWHPLNGLNEITWIWLPALLVFGVVTLLRRNP